MSQIKPTRNIQATSVERQSIDRMQDVPVYNFKEPATKLFKKGTYVLFAALVVVSLWSISIPIDEGVPTHAIVVLKEKGKAIQHTTGGLVERVLVKEGQYVHKGDILISLNKEIAKSNYDSMVSTVASLTASEARLTAEAHNGSAIIYPTKSTNDINLSLKKFITSEENLFFANKSSISNEIKYLNQTIDNFKTQQIGLESKLKLKITQQENLARQIQGVSNLVDAGYSPLNQLLQLNQTYAELQGEIAIIKTSILSFDNNIAEAQTQIKQKQENLFKESSEKLVEVTKNKELALERLSATKIDLAHTHITSPVDGQVIGLTLASTGGSVSPGQKLMEISPIDEGLVLETKIPQHLIDRVSKSDSVEIKFTNFSHSPQLMVPGSIVSLSNDVITESTPSGLQKFYLARIDITKKGYEVLGQRILQPGMQAEVLIKTGKRSFLTYLIHPLKQRLIYVLREE